MADQMDSGFDVDAMRIVAPYAGELERAAEAGADVFVAGSAVYRADDALAAICELREAASSHRHDARDEH